MDWIGHHNDIAHWGLGLDNSGPKRVEAVDWAYIESDIYDTPRDFTILCEYADGHETHISSANPIGVKWIGDDGWIYARRGAVEASDDHWLADDFSAGDVKLYHSENHTRNFLDCMRSRKPCVAPAETGHRSITPGHLAFVSHELGRALDWDPETQTIKNDEDAQTLLMHHEYRAPWSLPTELA